MSRTEFVSRLNGLLIKCNEFVAELEEDFKDTERWLKHLRKCAGEVLAGGEFVIPKTPAGVRKKRRLSVIQEFDSGETSYRPSYGVSKVATDDKPRVVIRSIGRKTNVNNSETSSESRDSDKHTSNRESSLQRLKPLKISVKRLSKKSTRNGRSKRITRSTRSTRSLEAKTDVRSSCLEDECHHDVESDCVKSPVTHFEEERVNKCQENENASPSNLSSELRGSQKLKSHVSETEVVKNGNSFHMEKENGDNYINTSSNVFLVPGSKGEQINPVCVNVENNNEINVNTVGNGKNSNASSAYYSMVTEESHSEKNRSSYLTAASLHETSHLHLSDRHKITEVSDAPGDLQQEAIHKENVPLKTTFKSPTKVIKSPLFSPYTSESVKKRVAAYEGLSTLSNGDILKTTKRVTRSKARALFAKEQEVKKNNKRKSTTLKQVKSVSRAVKKIPVKNDAGKENSFVHSTKKAHVSSASKILSDVNVLSTSQLNSSKQTPLTAQKGGFANVSSTSVVNKTVTKPCIVMLGTETWIKKAPQNAQDTEMKKLEELKKREYKEREVQQRREEILKKRAEELRKKEGKRLRVMQNREAQDKEKQESKLRVGRERDEKLNMLLHEREAKQKEEILKKKQETEKKAAEAKRKLEEAEAARAAKLKMDEKLAEEAEREFKKRIEEKGKMVLKEKNNIEHKKGHEMIVKKFLEKNTDLDSQLDHTFSIPNNDLKLNAMANGVTGQSSNNICNLEDLMSGSDDDDSDDENQSLTAPWAKRPLLHWQSRLEVNIMRKAKKIFASNNLSDITSLFPNKRLQRSSSARWDTPPRYSTLPLY